MIHLPQHTEFPLEKKKKKSEVQSTEESTDQSSCPRRPLTREVRA